MQTITRCAALLALAACGRPDVAALNVFLVDGPTAEFREINVAIHAVELDTPGQGGWTVLSTPDRVVNLLTLRDGVVQTLADQAGVPAGHYHQLRLILGDGNTVMLNDGTVAPLTVPSGMQTGIKLPLDFEVEAGTTRDIFIDFDAHRSVQVTSAGNSDKYILRPTVRAFDRVVTGEIIGRFTDEATGAALKGVIATAQTHDASGRPSIARTAFTREDGTYQLDLLPVGTAWHVVSQPLVENGSFFSAASGGVILTEGSPHARFDAAFVLSPQTGAVHVNLAAPADDSFDTAMLLVKLEGREFIIRSAPLKVSGDFEEYLFERVPLGHYRVIVERSSSPVAALDVQVDVGTAVLQVTR